jgi:hypothetical protein
MITTKYFSQTKRLSEKANTTFPKAIILLHIFKILQGITNFNIP